MIVDELTAALFLLALVFGIPIYLVVKLFRDGKKRTRRIEKLEEAIERLEKRLENSALEREKEKATTSPEKNYAKDPIVEGSETENPISAPIIEVFSPAEEEVLPPPLPSFAQSTKEPDNQAEQSKDDVKVAHSYKPLLFRLKSILISIGLYPPEDLQKGEVGLVQWWAPRIGGLCGLLALLFLATYVAADTSPWVRIIQLVIVNFVVTYGGFYFLKKKEQLGISLLSTGLAMFYLTSVAAYVAPPVRVISSPLLGISVQLITVASIFFIGLQAKRQSILILATLFTYLSAIFSTYEGFREAALVSSLFVYLFSVLLLHQKKGKAVFSIASIGVYLPVLSIGIFAFLGIQDFPPSSVVTLSYLSIVLLVYPLFLWKNDDLAKESSFSKVLLGINTSMTLFCGYSFFKFTSPEELSFFYGWIFFPFLLMAGLYGFRSVTSYSFQLFYLKASAIAALWFMNYFSGDVRWMALIIQAVLLAITAKHSLRLSFYLGTLAIQAISFCIMLSQKDNYEQLWEIGWILFNLYLLLHILSFSILAKAFKGKYFSAILTAVGTIGISFAWIIFGIPAEVSEDGSSIIYSSIALLISALFLIPWSSRNPVLLAAGILFVSANISYWIAPYSAMSSAVILAISFAALFILHQRTKTRQQTYLSISGFFLHFLWITSLFAYAQNFASITMILPVLLFIAILVASNLLPLRAMSDAAFIPLLLAFLNISNVTSSTLQVTLSVVLYSLALLSIDLVPGLRNKFSFLKCFNSYNWLGTAIFLSWFYHIVPLSLTWETSLYLLLFIGVLYFIRLIVSPSRSWAAATLLLFSFPFYELLILRTKQFNGISTLHNPWESSVLAISFLTSISFLLIGVISKVRSLALHSRFYYIPVILATFCFLCGMYSTSTGLQLYYTAMLAGFFMLTITIGIFAQITAYRIAAIVGFLIPLGRLFIFDIQETLPRIIAFALLALLLTGIGYLYSKFQGKIEE